MLTRHAFGATGFESSRILFGAAALAAMKPERVEQTLSLLEREGVNHIDTAAGYGDSELNLQVGSPIIGPRSFSRRRRQNVAVPRRVPGSKTRFRGWVWTNST